MTKIILKITNFLVHQVDQLIYFLYFSKEQLPRNKKNTYRILNVRPLIQDFYFLNQTIGGVFMFCKPTKCGAYVLKRVAALGPSKFIQATAVHFSHLHFELVLVLFNCVKAECARVLHLVCWCLSSFISFRFGLRLSELSVVQSKRARSFCVRVS